MSVRHFVIVLGDQLDRESLVLEDFDPLQDRIWMAECEGEATYAWSHKARIVIFLSAMRHFRNDIVARGWPITYRQLGEHDHVDLVDALRADIQAWQPTRILLVQPGEYRLRESLRQLAADESVDYAERPDRHFFVSPEEFADWAKGKAEPRMEFFYRWIRQRVGILMEGGKPTGGRWNFDSENRHAFGAQGPGMLTPPHRFRRDDITREVIDQVEDAFAAHPGELDTFDWPVTPEAANVALRDFIEHRLAAFGHWQDAMWSGEPWLYHARLSTAMNLKLLHPRTVVDATLAAYAAGHAPLAAVEGFIRQVLGWREFVRGMYWIGMPGLVRANALRATRPLPTFYWDGDTDMRCLRETIGQTLTHGYAHHIQRLMVTGNFALLLGVEPRQVHMWYLAIYVDAVEWVEAPNTLAMSQFADGGRMVSKPYVASGRYIERMSDYCRGCRYRPGEALGDDACPFTTLYWDFLDRHRVRFEHHPRAALQWKSLEHWSEDDLAAIRLKATELRKSFSP